MNTCKPFFYTMNKKIMFHRIEWCTGKVPGLYTSFFKTNTWFLKFMLYHAAIKSFRDTLVFFSILCPTRALGAILLG